MVRAIDLELDLPTGPAWEGRADYLVAQQGASGMANYGNIFGSSYLRGVGMTREELEKARQEMAPEQFESMVREKMQGRVLTLDDFVAGLEEAGIRWGVIDVGRDNDQTARVVAQYPDKFIGIAWADPHKGMAGVRELERGVKELGLKMLMISPFRQFIKANDKKYYPLYAKAAELGIPVRVYCTMNYATDRPMDLGRPIYLDEVAIHFPELKIIAGLGGWPWVPELVGLARRHPNVYIDFAAHRPKYLAQPGSGWEMLLQFGNTLLQDKVVFASSWLTIGISVQEVLKEVTELPLKEDVKDKWLYRNAARLMGLD